MGKSNRSSQLKNIGLAGAAAAALYAFVIRPWHLRWGTNEQEISQNLPGDKYVPYPQLRATHAVTIYAAPDDVWPWIVQIGQGRGGFYSYEWIENLMRLDIHSASRILPEYQQLKVGDQIPLAADGFSIPVAILDSEKALVLHGDSRSARPGEAPVLRKGDYLCVSWGFYLSEQPHGTSRLVERFLAEWNCALHNTLFYRLFLEPGAFLMERKMLLGIKERAETYSYRADQ